MQYKFSTDKKSSDSPLLIAKNLGANKVYNSIQFNIKIKNRLYTFHTGREYNRFVKKHNLQEIHPLFI